MLELLQRIHWCPQETLAVIAALSFVKPCFAFLQRQWERLKL